MMKLSAALVLLLSACASDGADGANGTNGTDGTNGTNGTNGSDGTNGTNGTPFADPGVYTLMNQTAGNQVGSFLRGENGNLTRDNEYATGGAGTAMGIGSQGAIAWDAASQRFFAVNPGDNTISMLQIDKEGVLTKLASIASGGTKPVSIAVHGDAVYVLNYGNTANAAVNGNITGFKIVGNTLVAIPASTQALSGTGDVHPTDIVFTPDGKFIVVAERFGNTSAHLGKLDVYAVTNDVAAAGTFVTSAGNEPFAIDFSPEGYMLVAEVGNEMPTGSSVSSYSIGATGALTPITSALNTHQGAACWIVSVGGFAYIANTATSTITGVNVSTEGAVTLMQPTTGMTVATGATPTDLAVSRDRGYLYSLDAGSHTINIYSIQSDGSLITMPALAGLPVGTSGLAAR